jgi:hypothetical protein
MSPRGAPPRDKDQPEMSERKRGGVHRAVSFVGLPTASFVINGAAPPQNLALATGGAEWHLRNGWSVMAKFDGEFASGSETYTGTAWVKYSW